MVVMQGRFSSPISPDEASKPKYSAKPQEVGSRTAEDDDEELLEMLLNLGVDTAKPTASEPVPTAASTAEDIPSVSRQGVSSCQKHLKV